MTLSLLQGFVANQGDAWNFTLDYLERFLEQCLVKSPEQLVADGVTHTNYLVLLNRLGQRTGELHRALAKQTGNSAFDPEPIGDADLSHWRQSLHADLERTFGLLRSDQVPDDLADLARAVLAAEDSLKARIDEATGHAVSAIKTRHHGDYHLGQVLVAENDFIIIDFEGEPERPLEERRAKHSALRDVAGMLRSFDYAAHAALLRTTAERPDDMLGLEPFANDWRLHASESFLAGYRTAIGDCPVLPEDPGDGERLIDLFLLEKALYEISYEMNNRPDWLSIPLRGLLAALGTGEH